MTNQTLVIARHRRVLEDTRRHLRGQVEAHTDKGRTAEAARAAAQLAHVERQLARLPS